MDRLHDVIQIVMGWTDSHLHQFSIGKKEYTEFLEYDEFGAFQCGNYRLVDLMKRDGRTFRYLYDFGDCWNHEVTIQDSRFANQEIRYELWCLDGERACPPEDVGSTQGYEEFLEVIQNWEHEDHERFMVWSGGEFDSEKFDVEDVNWNLISYYRWSRDRLLSWRK